MRIWVYHSPYVAGSMMQSQSYDDSDDTLLHNGHAHSQLVIVPRAHARSGVKQWVLSVFFCDCDSLIGEGRSVNILQSSEGPNPPVLNNICHKIK